MLMVVLVAQVIILLAVFIYFLSMGMGIFTGAPYVGTNRSIARAMLTMAKVDENDVVMDLGCGLGNILLEALKEKRVKRVIGYDVNPLLIAMCRWRFFHFKEKAQFLARSIDHMEVHSDVTVITLYLLPNLMNRTIPVLVRSVPSTARIIAHGFSFTDIEPREIKHIGTATLRLYAMSDLIAAHTI